uniref:Uncharacterized protein n=1 Tax=Engystomops pustulosus TaxID=76066 RepID=A0AAV6Z632_ENGPU|nr:hypothetical protein GDO81_029190 [Engystomops pustulosus]
MTTDILSETQIPRDTDVPDLCSNCLVGRGHESSPTFWVPECPGPPAASTPATTAATRETLTSGFCGFITKAQSWYFWIQDWKQLYGI